MAASAAAPSSRPMVSISLEAVVGLGRLLLERIDELDDEVDGLDRELWTSARGHEETARLMAIPGIGPVATLAPQAIAAPMKNFRRWRGLRQTSRRSPAKSGLMISAT